MSSIIPTMDQRGVGALQTTPNNKPFMTPWLDYSTVAVPDNHELVMWWSQYMWISDGNYRTAMERVGSHFMTTLEFPDLEPDEESAFRDLFTNHMDYRRDLLGCAYDYLCFHGDTKAITRAGVFKLRDLEGQTVEALSKGGVYREATFKKFGTQELLEVEFSDGRTVLATPDHEWEVKNFSGKEVTVATKDLHPGYRIPRVVADRPKKNDEYWTGLRHGFVFGDGSTYNKHRDKQWCVANFYGAKDREMLRYFEGVGNPPCDYPEKNLVKVHGLPAEWKQLPANTSSASYWYGFICGFLAADGSVDTHGCVVLTQKSRATLEAISEQLPRVGMAPGPVRGHTRVADLSDVNGCEGALYEGEMHYLTLLKRFMQADDLLLSSHRAKFEENYTATQYGKYIGVREVRTTGVVDEVFCCQEMETHTFVLDGAILTKNCYGNGFTSIYLPFKRFVRCTNCKLEQPLSEVSYKLEFNSTRKKRLIWNRKQLCPRCNNGAPYDVFDRRDPDLSKIKINRYDPSDIEIAQNGFSLRKEFYWRIPEETRRDILGRARIHIDDTPLEVLEAVAVNGRLRFEDDMLLHQSEVQISGLRTRGWGIPRAIANFRTAWLQQLTNKQDQAVAIDYTLGMRVISPTPTAGGQDPMVTTGMENFSARMQNMVQQQRNNPVGYHVSPYPLEYQFLGGEGANLLPPDKLKFRHQEYLNQLGVPLEYHQMNLSTQAAPMALRLFEAYWQGIPAFYNKILDWVVDTVSRAYGLDSTTVKMEKTTIADDMERKAVLLQLMSANQLSPQTALQPFGIDAHDEVKRVMSHQDYVARVQAEYDERAMKQQEMGVLKGMTQQQTPSMLQEQQMMQQQGAMGGGAPMDPMAAGGAMVAGMGGIPMGGMPGPTGQSPQSLTAISDQANQIAEQLVVMDDYSRKQELKALREGNKDLHDLVTSRLEDLRGQARSQGGQMLLQGGM